MISILKPRRQQDQKFKVILDNRRISKPAWVQEMAEGAAIEMARQIKCLPDNPSLIPRNHVKGGRR